MARAAALARADARDLVAAALPRARTIERFCIYSTGRTGSELLVELLNSHPRVACDGEILAVPHASTRAVLLGRSARAARQGAKAYGFKLVNEHFRWTHPPGDSDFVVRQMSSDGFRFVRLRRRNLLRQAVSHIRAEATSTYHIRAGHEPVRAIEIDPVELVFKVRQLEMWEQISDMIFDGIPMLSLWYEDDLVDGPQQQDTLNRLFAWLGVDASHASSTLVRSSLPSLRDQISNFAEIERYVQGTRLDALLG